MFKRTKSYLLLTFIVLTGFAGRTHTECLSGKERKVLATDLKQGKKDLLNTISSLNDAQLNFKPANVRWSIKENVYHIALTEEYLWKGAEKAIRPNLHPGQKAHNNIPDDVFLNLVNERMDQLETNASLAPTNAHYEHMDAALGQFKSQRTDLVKFVKTTTENIRKCGVESPFGKIDTYQLLMFLSEHTNKHIHEIETIKNHPNFPK